jgi:hypothetical protein
MRFATSQHSPLRHGNGFQLWSPYLFVAACHFDSPRCTATISSDAFVLRLLMRPTRR